MAEAREMSPTQIEDSINLGGSLESSPDGGYRQTPRSLPPAPVSSRVTSPLKANNSHVRVNSLDSGHDPYSNTIVPVPPTKPIPMRPNSMILSRADSINRGSSTFSRGRRALPPTPLIASDFESLQKSSTGHLRTLSAFAKTATSEEFSIDTPGQEVMGLHGRRKLQRNDAVRTNNSTVALTSKTNDYGWAGRNWMDKQRQFLQAYEYLCHIGEAKEWIERIIDKSIPVIVELEEALRDGVTLAEVVEALQPHRRFRIFRHPKLQYRHSDNIAIFFRFLNEVELPELFRFELIDLYEKKNIPKVIYCIHALSWLLFRQGVVDFRIGNLVGRLEFEHHELEEMQKGLDKAGISMPSFGNMGADFGVEPTPEPEPVETEEERIDRELHESEITILDLQAQIRGATVRIGLGHIMQGLWDSEGMLTDFQARIRGDFARQISGYRLSMRRFAISLQSAARGFLIRNRQSNEEAFWESKAAVVLEIQSLIRAKRARDEVRETKSQLRWEGAAFGELEAAVKGFLTRKKITAQRNETRTLLVPIKSLQAAIRGMLLRSKNARDITILRGQEESVLIFQAFARAMLTRDEIFQQKQDLQMLSPIWKALQTVSRGKLLRNRISSIQRDLKIHSKNIVSLQSIIRAAATRQRTASTLSEVKSEECAILRIQSLIRGMILRQRLADDYEAIEMQTPKIVKLQACARALLLRNANRCLRQSLQARMAEITDLQGLARAMILRNYIGILLGEMDAEEDSVVAFQNATRGCLVRAKFAEKQRYFKENMDKVVKIQSFVRGRLQGEAYKGLTTGKNPPVNAVKNFVHLLNDNDFDFNEEIEFERLRQTVVQQVRQNEMVEQYIDQLDIKIALLVKNKITLDDVMLHQRTFGGHTGSLLSNTSLSSGNQFDLKALNKNSRKKLESYQQLFFSLQTQPQYLARLFKRIREEGRAEQECKRIETLMMGLFGYAQRRREEYYLLKLIVRSVKEEVDGSSSIVDYLRGNYFWSKLLANYTRSPRDRKFLRELLGPLIRDNIIEDPSLDLESDPMQIYRSAINNEELRTGQPSRRPLNVPREIAIKDKETRDLFIDHLRDLREISDQFLLALEDLLHKMPYGIRFVSHQIFQSLCERFPRESQPYLLQIVGQWVWRFYLQPALTSPEQVGVIERQLSPLQKRNLGEVAKVLSQVSYGKIFGGENVYLQPLNAYIGDAIQRMGNILTKLVSVPDAESTFDIDEFNDLYAKTKPTLYIKMADIFAIHNLVAAGVSQICPNKDDMLREIVQELGSAKNNESEMLGVSSSEIQMTLSPKLHDIEDPETEVNALFMETKRCILYIIRVQSGANLMEILVRNITSEDDDRWQALLREEFAAGSNARGAYSDVNTLSDITSMSYLELKRTALENIMKLEKMGRISRHNYYQDILNAIALDIRTKSRRRIQRQRELEGVRLTLGHLHEKAVYLEQQRKSYDNYIEQAMLTLQNKKGYVFVRCYHPKMLRHIGKNGSSCLSQSSTTTSESLSGRAESPSLDHSNTRHGPSQTEA